jgi:hypothetical protein
VRSARARREAYVGTWLPEPLLTDPASDASVHAETADSLSMALTSHRRQLWDVEPFTGSCLLAARVRQGEMT